MHSLVTLLVRVACSFVLLASPALVGPPVVEAAAEPGLRAAPARHVPGVLTISARPALQLEVVPSPDRAATDELVTVSLTATHVGERPADYQVRGQLPRGLSLVEAGIGITWSPRLAALFWDLEDMQPGQQATAQFVVRITAARPGHPLTLAMEAVGGDLTEPLVAEGRIHPLPAQATRQHLPAGQGGALSFGQGRLQVHVPVAASTSALQVDQQWLEPGAGHLYAFDLRVAPAALQRPLTVTLRLDPQDWSAVSPSALTFKQRGAGSDGADAWIPLPTRVDAAAGTVSVELAEGGEIVLGVADEGDEDPLQGLLAPSVLGLQASLWTGDASFAFPLDLPPAPGVTPALALAYSSSAANGMLAAHRDDHLVQAGHLGIGWDLATGGYISRDRDRRTYLNFAGGSYELVHVGGNAWKTVPESFLQITHVDNDLEFDQEFMIGSCPAGSYLGKVSLRAKGTNPWTVRTADGTTYTFGGAVNNHGVPQDGAATATYWTGKAACANGSACVASGNGQSCGVANLRAYQWNLVDVRPTVGPPASFHYDFTAQAIPYTGSVNNLCEIVHQGAGAVEARSFVRDTRLAAIEYNDARYRVDFRYEADRADVSVESWQPDGWNCRQQVRFSSHRLTDITVSVRPDDGPWSPDHVISRVALAHDYTESAPVPQARHLRLAGVTQHDGAGADAAGLPAYTFAYGQWVGRNGVVLTSVDNGYGGEVTLNYEHLPCGDALDCGGGPDSGRLVVSERSVSHWPGREQSTETFQYGGGRYVDENPSDPDRSHWVFYGFSSATRSLYTAGRGQLVRREITNFLQSSRQLKGKPWQEEVLAPDGQPLRGQRTWWRDSAGWPELWQRTEYDPDLDHPRVRTTYLYQASHQCSDPNDPRSCAQYGNMTQSYTFDATVAGEAERSSERWYYPRADAGSYLVNLPGKEIAYGGGNPSFGAIRQEHHFRYDGQAHFSDPPLQGLLTHEMRGRNLDGWAETSYTYDGYGNLQAVTRQRSSGDTTTDFSEYDSTFHAFATRVIRAYGAGAQELETATDYWGVNDGSAIAGLGRRFGRPRRVTDVGNGIVTGERFYDSFGRLCSVHLPDLAGSGGLVRSQIYRFNDLEPSTCNDGGPTIDLPPFDPAAGLPFVAAQRSQDGSGDGLKAYTFFDGLGRTWQTQAETDAADRWLTRHRAYDAQGMVSASFYPYTVTGSAVPQFAEPDPGAAALTYNYDSLGRLLRETQYDGSFSEHHYARLPEPDDAHSGRWLWSETVSDPAGRARIVRYDSFGRLAQVVEDPDGDGSVTGYRYDVDGRLLQATDAEGNLTIIEYDSLGRKVHLHDPDLSGTTFGVRDPGCETMVEHDGHGEDAWEAGGSGQIEAWSCSRAARHWGQRGLQVSTGSGSGWMRVRTYPTWQAGKTAILSAWVKREQGAGGNVLVSLWVDGVEKLVATSPTLTTQWQKVEGSATIPAGATDVRVMFRFPDQATVFVDDVNADFWWSYAYDQAGNLVEQVDARDQRIQFTYDLHDRLIRRAPDGLPQEAAEYHFGALGDACLNGVGRLCRSVVGSGQAVRNYDYDRRGLIAVDTLTVDGARYQTTYAHDNLGRVRQIGYPDGVEALTYQYDGAGHIDQLATSTGSPYVQETTYDEHDRLVAVSHGGAGLEDRYGYHGADGNFRLASHVTRPAGGAGAILFGQHYQTNEAGDVVRVADETFGVRRFAYDALGRLCGASFDGEDGDGGCGDAMYEFRYAYDDTGNLVHKAGTTLAYFPHGTAHPHAVRYDGTFTYEVDRNGNLIRKMQGRTLMAAYAWTADNRLAAVFMPGIGTATFAYDADGRLVKQTAPDGSVTHLVGPHYEVQPHTGVVTRYVLLDGRPLAMRRTGDRDKNRNGRFTLHGDHLNSTSLVLDESLKVVDALRYLPFGEPLVGDAGHATTDRGFTGQRWQRDVGLYHYGARWYNPALGRFISPDTIVPAPESPQGLNRYSYVLNNPVNLTDPTGFCALAPWATGPEDRVPNLVYQSSCWSVYYNLVDQGIPGLDWAWEYGLGESIEEFAVQNYAVGSGAVLGLMGALSYAGYDVVGYQLLTVNGSVAVINGTPTYYVYLDESAAYDSEAFFYSFGGGNPGCQGLCPLVSWWLWGMQKPKGLPGRVDNLIPFDVVSDLSVAAFTTASHDYISQQAYVLSGEAYIDFWWNASGLLAFGHSVGTFSWAGSSILQYAKLARSGISTYNTTRQMVNTLNADPIRTRDLAKLMAGLPSH